MHTASNELIVDLQPIAELDQTLENIVHLGESFRQALTKNDPTEAQRIAIVALKEFGDIFVTPDLGVHDLLISMSTMLMNARLGNLDSQTPFLLKGRKPITGSNRGFGRDMVRGCAISVVNLLMERVGKEKLSASRVVAAWLTEAGFSFATDRNRQQSSVAGRTVCRWVEEPDHYSLAHTFAEALRQNHIDCIRDVEPTDRSALEEALRNKIFAMKGVLATLQ